MITSRRMAAVDRNAAALGVPTRVLMETAGAAVAQVVDGLAGPDDRILVVSGRGDNGGDGFVAARHLADREVGVLLAGEPSGIAGEAARANWSVLEAAELAPDVASDSTGFGEIDADLVIDALLGTGVRGDVREPVGSAIEAVNTSGATVVSVDVPSGVDPDTGESAGIAVEADHVVTFHDTKPGLAGLEAEVTVADIGIPEAAERFVGPGDRLVLGGRDPNAHKGDHGRVLVVGGGPFSGAPALCGLAALRAGADLVEVATPASAADAVKAHAPDLIVHELAGTRLEPDDIEGLESALDRADVLAVGPGLGDHEATLAAVRTLLDAEVDRIVVDADALAVLREAAPVGEAIATPHAGEFDAMGFDRPADWREAETAVAAAAVDLDATVLLKGRYDVVSDGERTSVNRTGNPGMTVGGTGDVLTGVVAALAHRAPPVEAAAVGVWATGRAGDRCLETIGEGFLASDVVGAIPKGMAVPEDTG